MGLHRGEAHAPRPFRPSRSRRLPSRRRSRSRRLSRCRALHAEFEAPSSKKPHLVAPAPRRGLLEGPQRRLSGKWVGDRIDNVSADDVARATGWVKGTSFEFAGDKVTVTIPAEAARTGTYKVAKIEGDKMVLAVTRPDRAVTDEATLTLLDEKTMRWDLGQTREVVLVRVQ